MSKLVTLSDYYLQDVPEGTLFLPTDVTSLPDEYIKPGQLVNRTKWHYPQTKDSWKDFYLVDHNKIFFLGKGLKVVMYERPDDKVLKHWGKMFGEENVPEFVSWGTEGYTVVKFPTEDLPAHLHSVDPDTLYKVLSKKFIGEIAAPQPKILEDFNGRPCVVKVAHGASGILVRFVHTRKEYEAAVKEFKSEIENVDLIVTELIPDVEITYCCHFYVTKDSEVQWIGAAEQYLSGQKSHGKLENVLKVDDQEHLKDLLFPACQAVGEALHKEGYFGYCGTDIVVDKKQQPYVVDVNPRVNGCTSLQLATLFLYEQKGYSIGSFRRDLCVQEDSLEMVIDKIENVCKGMAVLMTAVPNEKGFSCAVQVYADSEAIVEDVYAQIECSSASALM